MLAGMPFLQDLGLNLRVVAFAGAIALLAAVLFSLHSRTTFLLVAAARRPGRRWPRFGRKHLGALRLQTGGGGTGHCHGAVGGRRVARQELSTVCSMWTLDCGPIIWPPSRSAAPEASYGKDEQAIALGRQIVSRIGSLPGVKSVGYPASCP